MRRSGLTLALAGLLGLLFFWLTDPGIGWGAHWLTTENIIDAAHEARIPTAVGLIGSVVVLMVGLWVMTRKAA